MNTYEVCQALDKLKDKIAVITEDGKVLMIKNTIFCQNDEAIVLNVESVENNKDYKDIKDFRRCKR